jgi:pimeloyl-ACP methyl ester carboxylesterase
MAITTRHAIDRTIDLDVNGSRQRIRLCAEREGQPPLLIVQAGPGLPLLNEVRKFQQRLDLERDFLVGYWEQRGCGDAPAREAERVSMQQQVADLRTVLRWFFEETNQRVIVLAISIGGTFALQAAEHELEHLKAIVAVSPDSHTGIGDAAADAFIRAEGVRARSRGLKRRALGLPKPPYLNPATLRQRARVLSDLGAIEHGKTFAALLLEMSFSLLRTYGLAGTVRALRSMNLVQSRMLAQIDSLDLFVNPPRVAVPVSYVFGEKDALNPPAIVNRLPETIGAPVTTVAVVPDAGHMVHFDHPHVVRSIVAKASVAVSA